MKQLIAFRRRHLTLDNVVTLMLVISIIITSSSFIWREPIDIQFPKLLSFSSPRSASSQKIVVSTTVPNEVDSAVSDSIHAEARRQMTLEEQYADEIAEEKRFQEEQRILAERQAREDYISSIVCDPADVTRVSGLEREDFALLTQGTWWEGYEDTLYELETEHGINAMFAMSVSTLESGCGTSVRASSRHNYYGIELDKSWCDLNDCTLWWGGMMNRVYVDKGVVSVWNIGPIYCPPNRQWEVYMNDNMSSLYDSLINKLSDTTM